MMSRLFRAVPARFIAILCALVCCAFLVSCNREPKRALHLNLSPGTTYVLSVRTSGDATIVDADGKELRFPVTSENTFVLRPGQADEHGDVLVSVDTGKSVFPLLYGQLNAAFEGYTFGMKLSQAGRVTEFVDTEGLRQEIGRNMPGQDAILEGISDDALRSIIEPVTAIWPAVPVSVGDEWRRPDLYITYPGADVYESTTFRLESWDKSGAVVKFESSFTPAGKNKDFDLQITGTGRGEIHIAPAGETIRSFEANQEFTGTLSDRKSGAVSKTSSTYRIQAELTAR
jgi:hypothetical protein